MTYNVSSGTLNPTIPYHSKSRPVHHCRCCHLANLTALLAVYSFVTTAFARNIAHKNKRTKKVNTCHASRLDDCNYLTRKTISLLKINCE